MKSGTVAVALLVLTGGWAFAQGPALPPAAETSPTAPYASLSAGPPPTASLSDPPVLNPACCAPGGPAGPGGPLFYSDFDFLLYKVKAGTIPSAASSLPVGVLLVSTTDPLTGAVTRTPVPVSINSSANFGSNIDYGNQNGGRLRLGFWCDAQQTWGLEATGMFLQRGVDRFGTPPGVGSNPFIINTGVTPNVLTVTGGLLSETPGNPVVLVRQSTTSIVGSTSNNLYGGQLNARCVGCRIGCVDFGGLLGFRYLLFRDDVTLFNNTRLTLPAGMTDPAGSGVSNDLSFSSTDRVTTYNHFYGGQVGVDMDAKFGSFFVYTRFTAAAGEMSQTAEVHGMSQLINNDPAHPSPASSTNAGGLLSGPADQGGHTRNRFSFIPEVNVKIGYQFTTWLRGYVGYDALNLQHVARAGDTTTFTNFNSNVSVAGTSNNASVSQPTFRFSDSNNVLVQGLTFGLTLMY